MAPPPVRWLIVVGIGLVVGGCSAPDTGVLGNGQFRYLCGSSQADLGCNGSYDQDLPGAIAVGASFRIGYSPKGSGGGIVQGETGYRIAAASSELASTTGDTVVALRGGFVALFAEHVGNSTIDDFVHLQFAPVQTLRPDSSSLSLAAGETSTVAIEPLDRNSAPLAGVFPCTWAVTAGGQSVSVDMPAPGRSATVRATAGGTATVHVECVDAGVDLPVTVSGAPPADGGADG